VRPLLQNDSGYEERMAKSERRKASSKLRFEVNGESYMLTFNEGDQRWYLLTPSIGAVRAIPVLSDEFGFVAHNVVPMGDAGQTGIN